ncbi:unnamed protein product [Rhizopus microsporus]
MSDLSQLRLSDLTINSCDTLSKQSLPEKYKRRAKLHLFVLHTYLGRTSGLTNPGCTVGLVVIAQRRSAPLRTPSGVSRPQFLLWGNGWFAACSPGFN